MQRIAIVGMRACGKSTLARDLGRITGIKVFHMDLIFWREDGRWGSEAENAATINDVLAQPAYILEGPHGWAYQAMVAAADVVIWMDFGFVQSVRNALRRRRASARALGAGQPLPFGPDVLQSLAGFWWGFLNSWLHDRQHLDRAFSVAPVQQRVIRLRSFADARDFLDGLPK